MCVSWYVNGFESRIPHVYLKITLEELLIMLSYRLLICPYVEFVNKHNEYQQMGYDMKRLYNNPQN